MCVCVCVCVCLCEWMYIFAIFYPIGLFLVLFLGGELFTGLYISFYLLICVCIFFCVCVCVCVYVCVCVSGCTFLLFYTFNNLILFVLGNLMYYTFALLQGNVKVRYATIHSYFFILSLLFS